MPLNKLFYNYAEAAEILLISESSLLREIRDGKLIPRDHRGKKCFTIEDLKAYSDETQRRTSLPVDKNSLSKFQRARHSIAERSLKTGDHESRLPITKGA